MIITFHKKPCQKKIVAKQNYHKYILCIYKSGYLKSFKVALNYLQRDMISITFICTSFVL